MMKKNILFLFILFNIASYSQAVICYGDIKNYSVDTAEEGTPNSTPNGTLGSTYTWKILESNNASISFDNNPYTNRITITT